MATDKPGVMTFLNPEVYKRLVTFKETKQLRSLSHAAELALGEYFGVAIAPVIRHQPSPPLVDTLRSPETLTTKVDQLITDHESLHQAVLNLQHLTEHLLRQTMSTLTVLEDDTEPSATLKVSTAWLTSSHLSPSQKQSDSQTETCQLLTPLTDHSESVLSAALARKGLTGLQLAERLKVHSSIISRKKQKSYFKEWTSHLDPIGLGWKYASATRRFHPVHRQ
jgi:hypothetical protein